MRALHKRGRTVKKLTMAAYWKKKDKDVCLSCARVNFTLEQSLTRNWEEEEDM